MAQVISRTDVRNAHAGQLMFYLVSHALKALGSGTYVNEVGLYTEGFQVCI